MRRFIAVDAGYEWMVVDLEHQIGRGETQAKVVQMNLNADTARLLANAMEAEKVGRTG